jgi:hypothetical protein
MTDRLQRIIREHVRAKSLAHVDRDIDVLEKIDMVRQARMTGYRVSAQASAADDARRQGLIWQQQNRGHDGQRSPAQTVNVRNPKNASSASRDRGLGR